MLLKSYKTYKDGTKTEEIFYNKTSNFTYTPEADVVSHLVHIFKYEVGGTMPPSVTTLNGKRYIVPSWIEVHPQTELSDVVYKQPQKRPRADIVEKIGGYKTTFNSTTGKFKCSCMGFWRSKGNCKHVKELREKLS
jgi:hypothetical protein